MGKLRDKYKYAPVEVKASAWYTVCNVLQNCIALITVPIFTRLLTTEEYGLTNVYITWMSLAVIVATLNLQYGSFNTAMVKFEYDRDRYISSIQLLVTLITGVEFVLLVVLAPLLEHITGLNTLLVGVMGVQVIVNFAFGLWSGKKRFDYEYRSVVAVTLAVSLLIPIVGIAMVLAVDQGRGEMRILSMVLVQTVFYAVLYVLNYSRGKCGYNKQFWKYALGMNVALVPYYLAQMAFNSSDLLMINWYCGTADAGLYGVAYSVAVVLTVVMNAISSSFVPWKYRKFKARDYDGISKVTNGLAFLVAAMMLLLALAGPEAIALIAAPQYFEARWVIPPVAISMFFLFLTQLFIDVEFYFEDKVMLVCGSISAAVANIVLNALLIPVFGYIAAAYTTLISYILFFGANVICTRRTLARRGEGMVITDFCDLKTMIAMAFAMIAAMFVCVFLYQFPIIRYVVLVVGVVVAFVLREKIYAIIKKPE